MLPIITWGSIRRRPTRISRRTQSFHSLDTLFDLTHSREIFVKLLPILVPETLPHLLSGVLHEIEDRLLLRVPPGGISNPLFWAPYPIDTFEDSAWIGFRSGG
jgi:hypothetical protein